MDVKAVFPELQKYQKDAEDIRFESLMLPCFAPRGVRKHFYAKLAGTSYKNADGEKRTEVIDECVIGENLLLVPAGPTDQFPEAVGVACQDGRQLGWLDSRLAGEIRRDAIAHGPNWVCLFRKETNHPDTDRIVGCIVCLIRLEPVVAC